MIRIYLVTICFIFFAKLIGQNTDKTFYLLGAIDDFAEREDPKSHVSPKGFVMTMHQQFIGEIKRIENITGKKFKKLTANKNCKNCDEFYQLISKTLARKINSFYDFANRNDKIWFPTGTLNGSKVLNGSQNQKLSFVSGIFLTRGVKDSLGYKIILYNSQDRFECVKKVLTTLNCDILKEEVLPYIPIEYFIYFKPSALVKSAIDREITARETTTK